MISVLAQIPELSLAQSLASAPLYILLLGVVVVLWRKWTSLIEKNEERYLALLQEHLAVLVLVRDHLEDHK